MMWVSRSSSCFCIGTLLCFFVLVHGFAEWTGAVMKITEREISLRVSPKQKFSTPDWVNGTLLDHQGK